MLRFLALKGRRTGSNDRATETALSPTWSQQSEILQKISQYKQVTQLARLIAIALLLVLSACDPQEKRPQSAEKQAAETLLEEGLVFDNATLEQSDPKGQVVWKINAEKAVYTQENKNAQLVNVTGNLYQDGKAIIQIRAKTGEIVEDGKKLFLRKDIVAIDPRNQAVLKGEELEWLPEEDLVIVRTNLKGSDPNMDATAKEGRYSSRTQQMELIGEVKAISKDPPLQLRTEHLLWKVAQKQAIADRKLEIDRYQGKKVTDRVIAGKGNLNLTTKVVTLAGNTELKSIDPLVQIASESAIWNTVARTVIADKPVQVLHKTEQFTVTGNKGFIDLTKQMARMEGGVRGISPRKQANLYANQIIWEIPKHMMRATGNVVYKQVDPPLHLNGPKATANLKTQEIQIARTPQTRVVTEIIPD